MNEKKILSEQKEIGSDLSRREFLKICETGAAGLVFSLLPAEARALIQIRDGQLPAKSNPFDSADFITSGTFTSHDETSADRQTGKLVAKVKAQMRGANCLGAGGYSKSYVRWNYSHNAPSDIRATVSVRWVDENIYPPDIWHDDEGGASTSVIIGVMITDATEDSSLDFIIKKFENGQWFVPASSEGFFYKECPVIFKRGHSYTIDAYLYVRADVFSGKAAEPTAAHAASGGSGYATQKAEITVKELRLRTMEPPWIQTDILAVWEAARDTYQVYEQALRRTLKKDYFSAGARIKVSAGGRYDKNSSQLTIGFSSSRIIQIKNSPLQYSLSDDRRTVHLQLPECDDLPLEGATWNLNLIFDPQFSKKFDDWDFILPVYQPILGMMSDVALAAGRYLKPETEGSKGEKQAQSQPETARIDPARIISPAHFFNLENYYSVLPLQFFMETIYTPKKIKPEARAKSSPAPVSIKPLPVSIYIPSGEPLPKLDPEVIKLKPLSPAELSWARREFTTEPVVITRINDLWMMLVYLSDDIDITGKDLVLCANPPWLNWLNAVGERMEAHKEYISRLCFKLPSGEIVKLVDLPENFDPDLSIDKTLPGGDKTLYIYVAGMMIPVALFFSKRLRRWIRRTVTADLILEAWNKIRPREEQQVSVYGYVSGTLGSNSSRDSHSFKVVFDFIPRLQPWSLYEPY